MENIKDWTSINQPLSDVYEKKNILHKLEKDETYLKNALIGISDLWEKQFEEIEVINYVMFSEAPLWGKERKYMYNIETNFSQFFYKSDLEFALEKNIKDKEEFLEVLRSIGFIIVDLSPFALKEKETEINYKNLSKKDYLSLVEQSSESYLIPVLKRINNKASNDVKYFFRYTRVQNLFNNLIKNTLCNKVLINSKNSIGEIAQRGGGIDRVKLKEILSNSII